MGTRSLTYVMDDRRKKLLCMYRHMDGYPSGHGEELAEFLRPITLCNGVPLGADNSKKANGAGCLAAQIVAHFKTGIGGIYLRPTDTKDAGQDYVYIVHIGEDGLVTLSVYSDRVSKKTLLWLGFPKQYNGQKIEDDKDE